MPRIRHFEADGAVDGAVIDLHAHGLTVAISVTDGVVHIEAAPTDGEAFIGGALVFKLDPDGTGAPWPRS